MSTATSSRQAEVTVNPGEEKEILISQSGKAETAPAGTAASTLSSTPSTEPVAEVTIHMEPEKYTEHPSQAHEVKEEAKETMKKGVQSGVKSMAGMLARGGLNMIAKSLHPKKESPKTPLSEEEMAKREATFISASALPSTTSTTQETSTTGAAPSKTSTAKEKVKMLPQQLIGTMSKVAQKMSSDKEVPPGQHSAPVEHTLATFAHIIHKNSSMIGHGAAKALRKSQAFVEKDENKRNQILDELAIEKLLFEGGVQRRLPSELTSIEDINLAVHEITDLIAFKLVRARNKLVSREKYFTEKEFNAKRSGHDFIRQAEHALKERLLGYAKKGAAKVSETVTEKTGVNVIVPEVTGTEVVEKCHLEVKPKTDAAGTHKQEFATGTPGFSTIGGASMRGVTTASGSSVAGKTDALHTLGAASTVGETQGTMKQPEFGAEAGKSTTSSQRLTAQ